MRPVAGVSRSHALVVGVVVEVATTGWQSRVNIEVGGKWEARHVWGRRMGGVRPICLDGGVIDRSGQSVREMSAIVETVCTCRLRDATSMHVKSIYIDISCYAHV